METFDSKRDPLVAGGVGLGALVSFSLFIYHQFWGWPWLGWVFFVVCVWLATAAFATRYQVGDDKVVIWSGIWPKSISKETISRVVPGRSWVAHACLSRKQFMILYLVDGLYHVAFVSPDEPDRFLEFVQQGTALVKEALVGLGPPPPSLPAE